jgi:hypothetical protein
VAPIVDLQREMTLNHFGHKLQLQRHLLGNSIQQWSKLPLKQCFGILAQEPWHMRLHARRNKLIQSFAEQSQNKPPLPQRI